MADEDTYGLNLEARLKAERQKEIEDKKPLPLEPSFPFTVAPFDPLFFGAQTEWEPEL